MNYKEGGPARGGGGPKSLVGILKCLVSAFCQGFTSLLKLSDIHLSLSVICRYFIWALLLLFGPCCLLEFTLAGPQEVMLTLLIIS